MSVLATTKHSLCNCIDTWQTGCIFIVKKKKKAGLLGIGWTEQIFFSCKIFYTKVMQSFFYGLLLKTNFLFKSGQIVVGSSRSFWIGWTEENFITKDILYQDNVVFMA